MAIAWQSHGNHIAIA
jgi:hypothetical protein